MKKGLKITLIVILSLIVLYFVAGFIFTAIYDYNRVKNLELSGETITISDEEYYNYLEELYTNPEKYKDKKIIIEGIYDLIEGEEEIYHIVGKEIEMEEHKHDDECGDSHLIGIEFIYEGDTLAIGDYIQVSGILDILSDDEGEYLTLKDCIVNTDIPDGAKTIK